MNRRTFIKGVATGLVAAPVAAPAQPKKIPVIGYLATGSRDSLEFKTFLDAFRRGLRERGYVEGQSIIIEYRYADGKIERFPALAKELVALKTDVIVAPNTPAG